MEYLKSRGLSGVIARDFGLGFAPPGWDNLMKHLGGDALQHKAMLDAGLLIENTETGRSYDRFRDRVMFPIRDSRGRIIAFGGRVLGDDKPKYLNSPETPVFHKGQELYGLFEARKANRDLDEIMVVEGYMDVIALAQQGLRNAVATLGTATSDEHLKRLFRIVPSVLFCFDGDAAGRKAAWRALEATLPNLQDGKRARFLFLPDGEDPDSLVRREGTDAFRARINQHAQPLADYFFQQLSEEADPRSLEGKAHLVTLAAPLIDRIPGNHLRTLMRQRLSEITGLSGEMLQQVAQSTPPAPNHRSATNRQPTTVITSTPNRITAMSQTMPTISSRRPRVYEQQKPWQKGESKDWKKKGEWKKGGDWKKGPRNDAPPRKPVHVESPTLTALRTLLHHPQLAQKVEDVSHFADEEDTYAQLLVALVGTLQKSPRLRSLQLIARWHVHRARPAAASAGGEGVADRRRQS